MIKEVLKSLLAEPQQVTFGVLFVCLLIWVMWENNKRELKYQQTIEKYQKTITNLVESLKDVESVKMIVEKIHVKLKGSDE